ncbi:urease accessory protein UreE [Phyllobacterium sp. 1468]|uniref:urease accessory protein UreE n=1 Tax=Phyllobacterium sp. 1468 TaxID=2817759 RepID=UPI00286C5B40|nr:urease accessory protein UreE [Phyllobacterium sp. 1468]
MLRAVAVRRASEVPADDLLSPLGRAVLQHDERHLRRRVIELVDGRKVLVDLAEPVVLENEDRLVLDGGGEVLVVAAQEQLYEISGENSVHLMELSWHIGNRHLAAAINPSRILILRDHVIKAMLEGLGARVEEIVAQFHPVRGAHFGQSESAHVNGRDSHAAHTHTHAHSHNDGHHHDDHHHGSGGHGHE